MPSNTPFNLPQVSSFLFFLQSVGMAAGSFPETITLPASDPVATYSVAAAELLEHGGSLSFSITPVYHSPEEAAAFLQGAGIALAFVDAEEKFYIAAFDGAIGTAGDWLYAELNNEDAEELSITIAFDGSSLACDIEAGGNIVLKHIPFARHKSGEVFTFYGDSSIEIMVSNFSIDIARSTMQSDKYAEYLNALVEAQSLRELKWKPYKILHRAVNRSLVQGEQLFSNKLKKLPSEYLDKAIGEIVFIDNVNGDDINNGFYPSTTSVGFGPVKSMDKALALSGEGKILIFLPSEGAYVSDNIIPKRGTEAIITIGDVTLIANTKERANREK